MILGTAGHIDHGKTALVRALTGVDTDRLPEEKRRGITIELGFAPLTLDGVEMSIVDVPGHEAFVRTMLAGATGVDLALLVIAADEGPMPQTREHLAILTLLGVRAGVIALTKSDLVEAEWLAMLTEDVRALVAGSPLEGAPIVACSAITGAGLPELRAALAAAARNVPARDAADLVRLPIDRAFTVKGTGTVVTGTLWSGTLDRDATVVLHPGALPARIRALESHGAAVASAMPGHRIAVALGGLERAEVSRSGVVVRAEDAWRESTVLRADVALLDAAASLGPRTRVRFHLGTTDVGARVSVVGGRLENGTTVPARLVLDAPVVARAGDRFVLRTASPPLTIGGGIVTDPHPPGPRSKPFAAAGASVGERAEWMVRECGGAGLAVADLPVRLGVLPSVAAEYPPTRAPFVRIGTRLFDTALRDTLRTRLTSNVSSFHAAEPLAAGLPLERARTSLGAATELFDDILGELVRKEKLVVQGSVVARKGFSPASGARDAQRLDDIAAALLAGGGEPPSVPELAAKFGPDTPALLRLLEKQKRAVAVASDRYFSPEAVSSLLATLQAGLVAGTPVTASQVRETLGLSRKFVIPLLEYLDRRGISRRDGDFRTFDWSRLGESRV